MDTRPDPTPDELQAMAYADGELSLEARGLFEERLRLEPKLAAEIAEYHALQVLARQIAPPEPMDYEWRRIEADPANRWLHAAGWSLFVGGAIGLTCLGVWRFLTGEGALLPRALSCAAIGGALALLLGTARNRLRTLHLDPYRRIQR